MMRLKKKKTRETGKVGEVRNLAWLYFNIGWTVLYLLWRTFCTVPLEYGILSAVAGIALLVVEILGMLEAFVHYFNMYKIENHEVPRVPAEEFPDVDVFIATYNEPVDLLYKTVNGCIHMKYPDKNKVHIYLCDDGKRQEMRELAEQMGVGYIDREDHEGAKAGNLNHAMSVTSSPLIATFDADMLPKNNFLMVMVSYFVHQEIKNRELEEKDRVKIGFIQSPQSFYNPDLFQFNLFSENRIPNEQDYFYKDVQITRYADDGIAHCVSQKQAKYLRRRLEQRFQSYGLELNQEKTRIVYCKDDDRRGNHENTSFDFLGYTFRPRHAKNRYGKFFTNFLPAISEKAKKAIRKEVRGWKLQLKSDKDLYDIANMFNRQIQGWINYYTHFYKSEIYDVLRYINGCLVKWVRRKYKKRKARRKAEHWLGEIAKRDRNLFAHWKVGILPAAG